MNEVETKYFKDEWKPDYSKFKLTGWALMDKINDTDTILDIGCGYNLFKEKFGDRLYGIDPANDAADEMVSWEDYRINKDFSVFLILGSLNFGTEKEVEDQVRKLARDANKGTRLYWRQNPGLGDHPWKGVKDVRFYPWNFQKNIDWCDKYGFRCQELAWDSGDRIYAEWIKL